MTADMDAFNADVTAAYPAFKELYTNRIDRSNSDEEIRALRYRIGEAKIAICYLPFERKQFLEELLRGTESCVIKAQEARLAGKLDEVIEGCAATKARLTCLQTRLEETRSISA